MNELYIQTAQSIKLIMEQGFSFTEATRIYRLVSSDISDSNSMSFIDELFEFNSGWVKASEAYTIYSDWAVKNGERLLTITRFGLIMAKLVKKKKSNGYIMYEMSVKSN